MPVKFKHGIYFYWNDNKYKLVYDGRNIDFDEVISVFDDALHYSMVDDRFDYDELRMITIGMTNQGRLLTVVWFESDEDSITIITAFKPTAQQVKEYQNA